MPVRPTTAQTRNEQMMIEKAGRQLSLEKDPIVRLRLLCLQRGASGILGMGKTFRRMDDNQSGDLSSEEFFKGIRESGLDIAEEEAHELFAAFDRDSSGSINYEEFIRSIRPPMSQNRLRLVDMAFNKMDKSADGQITIDDLKSVFSVKSHPEYQNGVKTEAELLTAFLNKFEHNSSRDGIVTKEEFLDYYAGVSASIDEDAYFDLMMRQAWKL